MTPTFQCLAVPCFSLFFDKGLYIISSKLAYQITKFIGYQKVYDKIKKGQNQ